MSPVFSLQARQKANEAHSSGLAALLIVCLLTISSSSSAVRSQARPAISASSPTAKAHSSSAPASNAADAACPVAVVVSVTDKAGLPISGLKEDSFTIYDNDQPQEILSVTETEASISVGILVDQSGSMRSQQLSRIPEALREFARDSLATNEYSVISFSSNQKLLLDRARWPMEASDKLNKITPGGETAIYDALALGVRTLQQSEYKKRAILLITDGIDDVSILKRKAVRNMLLNSGIPVYTICVIDITGHNSRTRIYAQNLLNALTKPTGGRAFYPHNETRMLEDLKTVGLDLRHQYAVTYRANTLTTASGSHKLKIKVVPSTGIERVSIQYREPCLASPHAPQ